jgi:uncharacterized membrane protein YgdD (TMEM256/DUF423 family)
MMNLNTKDIALASSFLALAVMIGAFGAHGLEGKVTEKAMKTYQTGVTYHFYHGLGLILTTILSAFKIETKLVKRFFIIGILLFSFNCYLYAITGVKAFAMIVPLGGVSFILGWIMLTIKGLKHV